MRELKSKMDKPNEPNTDEMVAALGDALNETFNAEEERRIAEYVGDTTTPVKTTKRKKRTHLPADGEYTGGSVGYYTVEVIRPTSGGAPYFAECNDIIEALGLNYAEGNAFKAIWRTASARLGKKKRDGDPVYDAEKVIFFGQRMLEQAKYPTSYPQR